MIIRALFPSVAGHTLTVLRCAEHTGSPELISGKWAPRARRLTLWFSEGCLELAAFWKL